MSEGNLARAVFGFVDSADGGQRLAREMSLPFVAIETHHFPDGESLVRIPQGADDAILYRSLDRPNEKLIEIILASAEIRRQGANRLTLVAPYLAYMRQDIAFHKGEAVSQTIIGQLLANYFDRFITVNPHLHRTAALISVFRRRRAASLTAAPLIGRYLNQSGAPKNTLLVGPDEESAPLVRLAAESAGFEWIVAAKERQGDRNVTITLPESAHIQGRPVVIIDDVISSGVTIARCAALLFKEGAANVDVYTVHALFNAQADQIFRDAGIGKVVSCDSVTHPSNRIHLAPLLATELLQ